MRDIIMIEKAVKCVMLKQADSVSGFGPVSMCFTDKMRRSVNG